MKELCQKQHCFQLGVKLAPNPDEITEGNLELIVENVEFRQVGQATVSY